MKKERGKEGTAPKKADKSDEPKGPEQSLSNDDLRNFSRGNIRKGFLA